MPLRSRPGINSWLGVGLLCSITLWVTVFYIFETKKIAESKFVADYKMYYSLEGLK